MKIHELMETVKTIITSTDKHKYVDDVWEILANSYRNIGGFKSANSKDELINDSGIWKLVMRNGCITAVRIEKAKFGRKGIAIGSDGTAQGKQDVKMMMRDTIKTRRGWSEVSGAVEHLLLKAGGKIIPSKFAQTLTGKEILKYNDDGVHYTRLIMGMPHEKCIVGFIDPTEEELQIFIDHGIPIHDLKGIIK